MKAQDSASEARAQPLRWLVFAAFAAMLLWSCRAFFDFGQLFLELQGKSFLERGSTGANEWLCFLSRAGRREGQQVFSKVHRELALATYGGAEPAKVFFAAGMIAIVNPRARSPSRHLESVTVVRSERDLPSEILSKGSPVLVRSEKEFSSGLEDGWRWTAQLSSQLPPDAQVFLNEPSLMLYYFSTFMCCPRRVDVDTRVTKISNAETFEALFRKDPSRLEPGNLLSLGQKLRSLGYTHLVMRKDGKLTLFSLGTAEESIP